MLSTASRVEVVLFCFYPVLLQLTDNQKDFIMHNIIVIL